MANSVSLVTTFLALLDEIYKVESLTARMDAITQDIPFAGANAVKVMKLATVGLGTYSRSTGYPKGDVTVTWETMTLAAERGREFTLDRMDSDETLGLALGALIREWMRTYVAPELDAYRFAKYASWSSIGAATPATLTKDTVLPAIDAAMLVMDEAEVPAEGRILYASATVAQFISQAITRVLANETGVERRVRSLDGLTIIPVPQTRFYTAITLNAGATTSAGGFIKNVSSGKDLNFMLIHPSAVVQPTKLNNLKYFSPEVNQTSDGHKWQYRLYHDAFVEDNKVAGIYIHNKA